MDRFDDTEKEDNNLDQTNQDSLSQQKISVSIEPQSDAGNLNRFVTEYYHELRQLLDIYLPIQEDEYKLGQPDVSNQTTTYATTSNARLLLEKSQLPRNHGYENDVNNSREPTSGEVSINNYLYNMRHVNPPNDLINNSNIQEVCQESPLVSELNKKNHNFGTSGISRYTSIRKLTEMVDETPANNRERKVTNDQIVTDAIVTQKRPRIESSGYGCELISTDIREKGTRSDFANEINATAKGIEFDEIVGASVSSIVDVHANPGLSRYDEQKQTCRLRAEEFYSEAQEQNFQSKDRGTCLICQKGINEHVDECKEEKLYRCCVCNYQHKKSKNLRSHISYFGRQHFSCRFCKDAFKEKGSHEIDKRCTVCKHPELFPCRTFLVEHLYREHNQVCPACQKGIHDHIFNEKNYKCCTCPKKFLDKYHLERHFIACIMEKRFKCGFCGQRFKRSQSLPMHMKFKHSDTTE